MEEFFLFQKIRSLMTEFNKSMLSIIEEEDYRSFTKQKVNKKVLRTFDCLFELLLFLSETESDQIEKRISIFFREIFSIPFFTLFMSESVLIKLLSSKIFPRLSQICMSSITALPPCDHHVFHSGHFILGNMAHLSHVLFKLSNIECKNDLTFDQIYKKYIDAVIFLVKKYYVPGVFQNVGGVVWSRDGAILVAAGVPYTLKLQLLNLIDKKFSEEIFKRYFNYYIPFRHSKSFESDAKEMKDSLESSSLDLARESIAESIASSSDWGISSWFSKINSSISNAFSFKSKDPSKKSSKSATTNLDQTLKNENLSEKFKEEISVTVSFWSIIFPQAASSGLDSFSWKSISSFVFSTEIVVKLCALASHRDTVHLADSFQGNDNLCLEDPSMIYLLISSLLKVLLIAIDDNELYEEGKPIPLVDFLPIIRYMKMILYKSLHSDCDILKEPKFATSADPIDRKKVTDEMVNKLYKYHVLKSVSSVLSNLHTRWVRRPFSSSKLWVIDDTKTSLFLNDLRQQTPFCLTILRVMPWCISFHERMKFFREIIDLERKNIQGVNDATGLRAKGKTIRIKRNRILEDGKLALEKIHSIKDRITVVYINEFGEEEKGIDAGGLFKDFWTELSARVFDPSFGLFTETSNKLTYPNPSAVKIYDEFEINSLYLFLGRILGKALFENIVVQPQFSHFFLAFMHGRYNFMNLINDLATLDKELYKNLLFLKTYENDFSDLGLTFSIIDDTFGVQTEIDLIPGGKNRSVTSSSKHRYIQSVAKYYLHDRIQKQSAAFFHGLYQVIQPELLGMFCSPELQILISGAVTNISPEDLQANCVYSGGYNQFDSRIRWFWDCFKELNQKDKGLLLKFVTSCERPPSLGFSALDPPFTIQKIESNDDSRLPTASTCFNILKLPTYSSYKILKQKLLTSIHSGAGFDLS